VSDEACYADDIGDYRWEGFPLEQKVGWMQGAQGSAAVQPGLEALRGLSARYAASHRTVQAGLAKLGIGWQGQSADAAAGAVTQIADWVAGAGQTVTGGGGSMGTYGASFDAMRPHIQPAPVTAHPVAGPPGLADGMAALAGFQTPFSRQVERAAAADAQANAALRAHQQATRAALSSFPLVNPPPTVTAGAVSMAPANGGSGRAVWLPGGDGVAVAGKGSAGAGVSGGSVGGERSAGGGGSPGGGDHGTTTVAGAGAPTSTTGAGWTPLAPAAPNAGGLVGGPNGGFVPTPATPGSIPAYRVGPVTSRPTGFGRTTGPSGFGPQDGYSEVYRPPPLAPRTGAGVVRPQFGGDFGVPQSGPGRGPGPAGAPPVGLSGGGRGGQERIHRNRTFIPSDEPFSVEFFDVTPPVLGVRSEQAW
jgi:hypothetical protein